MSAGLAQVDGLKNALATLLHQRRDDQGPRPTAAGTTLRGSDAHQCSRRVAFRILGFDEDYPPDAGALANFEVGQDWHDIIQEALAQSYGAELEVEVDLRPAFDLSTHADAAYPLSGGTVAVEIKSKSEYAYGLYAKGKKGPYGKEGTEPVGPEAADVVQATNSAIGLDASHVHVIYVNKNRPSEMAEWLFGLDDPLPHLDGVTARQLAMDDLWRLQEVADLAGRGVLAERFVPGFGVIESPPAHHTVKPKAKGCWRCRWCALQATCASLPTGQLRVERQEGASDG